MTTALIQLLPFLPLPVITHPAEQSCPSLILLNINLSKNSPRSTMGKQFKRPPIPERFSSLVAQPHRRTMKESRARQVSYASNVSASSNASDFLESKILHLSAQIEYLDAYKAGLLQKHQARNPEDSEIRDEIQAIKDHLVKNNSEWLSVKRQKKNNC